MAHTHSKFAIQRTIQIKDNTETVPLGLQVANIKYN